MNISDILRHKGTEVVTIASTGRVSELVAQLAEHKIGALVVVDGDSVVGVASERDVVYQLHQRGAAMLDTPVSELMTASVVTCSSTDSVDGVAAIMTERRIRHMPVLDDGRLGGIVTIGDVVSIRIRQLEHDRGQLEQYITG